MSDEYEKFKKPDGYKNINHSSIIPVVKPETTKPETVKPVSTGWWNAIGGNKLEQLLMTCDK